MNGAKRLVVCFSLQRMFNNAGMSMVSTYRRKPGLPSKPAALPSHVLYDGVANFVKRIDLHDAWQ